MHLYDFVLFSDQTVIVTSRQCLSKLVSGYDQEIPQSQTLVRTL